MLRQPLIVRIAQPASDLIHAGTGWTCYRQGAALGIADACLMLASGLAAGLESNPATHGAAVVAVTAGGLATLKLQTILPPDFTHKRGTPYGNATLGLMLTSIAGAMTTLASLAWWATGIATATSGSMPLEVTLGLCVAEVAWACNLLRNDARFHDRCARGEITAERDGSDVSLWWDIAIWITLTANATHMDLPSGLAAAAATFLLASSAVGRCRPRPPRSRRPKSKLPWGSAARSGA